MKAKVILYGWALSWLSLFAGIGTMEHGSMLTGSLLCSVWFFFSYMLIGNEAACKREVVRFEEWMVRLRQMCIRDRHIIHCADGRRSVGG